MPAGGAPQLDTQLQFFAELAMQKLKPAFHCMQFGIDLHRARILQYKL